MDNDATHKAPQLKRWLQRNHRYHADFTPTGATWPNLVERVVSGLTTRQLRRGVHRSVRAREAAIAEYLAARNRDPKPFRRTASADAIFRQLGRPRARTSDSGH